MNESLNLNAFLKKELYTFHLKSKTQKVFSDNGIKTIQDLVSLSDGEFDILLSYAPPKRAIVEGLKRFYKDKKKKHAKLLKAARPTPEPVAVQEQQNQTPVQPPQEKPTPAVPVTTKPKPIAPLPTFDPVLADLLDPHNESPEPEVEEAAQATEDIPQKQKNPKTPKPTFTEELEIGLGLKRNRFSNDFENDGLIQIDVGEKGLRRHLLIAGSTGSGKTVAARQIIEQAAMAGIPSIVVDAKGDLCSQVLFSLEKDEEALFQMVQEIGQYEGRERDNVLRSIQIHLSHHKDDAVFGEFASRAFPRIFTPGRPDEGLSLAIPPFIDILSRLSESVLLDDRDDMLADEVQAILNALPKYKEREEKWIREIIKRIFYHANETGASLEGKRGLETFISLVQGGRRNMPRPLLQF